MEVLGLSVAVWILIGVGVVAWTVASFLVYVFLTENVSAQAAERFSWTLGIPLWVITAIIMLTEAAVNALKWPWRQFQHARFHGEFGQWVPSIESDDWYLVQGLVNGRLSRLAAAMNKTFEVQTQARNEATLGNIVDLSFYQDQAKQAKRGFWRAHGLAKYAGFNVYESYKSYLR